MGRCDETSTRQWNARAGQDVGFVGVPIGLEAIGKDNTGRMPDTPGASSSPRKAGASQASRRTRGRGRPDSDEDEDMLDSD